MQIHNLSALHWRQSQTVTNSLRLLVTENQLSPTVCDYWWQRISCLLKLLA